VQKTDRSHEWSTRYNAFRDLSALLGEHGGELSHAMFAKVLAAAQAGLEDTHFKVLAGALETLGTAHRVAASDAHADEQHLGETLLRVCRIQTDPMLKSKAAVLDNCHAWWAACLARGDALALWEGTTRAMTGKDGSNAKIKALLLRYLADVTAKDELVVTRAPSKISFLVNEGKGSAKNNDTN
jgi:hypothetical protein